MKITAQVSFKSERIENTLVIHKPAETIWNLISDFNNLPLLTPDSIEKIVVKGHGIQSKWTIYLPDGANVEEKMIAFDEKNLKLAYRMLVTPMPVKNYMGYQQVIAVDKITSKVTFIATFDVQQEHKDEWILIFNNFQKTFLSNIEKNIK